MLKGGCEVIVQTCSYLPVIWSKRHSVRSHLPQANTTGVERNSKFSRTWKNKRFLEKLWREAASSEVSLASNNPSRKLILESCKFQTQDMNKIKTVNKGKSSWSDICVSPPLPLCLLDGLMHVMDGWKHESPCCWMSFSPSFLFLRRQHLVSRRMVERTALGWTVMMTYTHAAKNILLPPPNKHTDTIVLWLWDEDEEEEEEEVKSFFSVCKVGLKSRRRAEGKQEVSCEVWGHWYKMCCEGLLRNQRVRGQFDRELGASGEGRGKKEVRVHIITWRRRCRERWSDREKERSHSVQRKGLIPVCLRKCRVSSSERAKRQVQPSQVQW